MKNVIAYIRVSTTKQADSGLSIASQNHKLKAYADLYDLNIVAIEIDSGETARSLDRPAMQRSLKMLKSGEAEGLLVFKLDRLTRSVIDLAHLIDNYFKDDKYSLISVSDHLDTKTAGGRLVLNVLTAVSQWEREAIGERTSAAMQELKKQGRYTGGAPRYGYKKTEDGTLQENESEQQVISEVETMKSRGFNLSEIAKKLTKAGRRSRTGKPFQAVQIRNMLAVVQVRDQAMDQVFRCGYGK